MDRSCRKVNHTLLDYDPMLGVSVILLFLWVSHAELLGFRGRKGKRCNMLQLLGVR